MHLPTSPSSSSIASDTTSGFLQPRPATIAPSSRVAGPAPARTSGIGVLFGLWMRFSSQCLSLSDVGAEEEEDDDIASPTLGI